ncbi:phosphoserine phosphatase SerB [Methanobacterium alcaliphilum]|uniref:phosphoserine phosphatase SerB n=1 Tax=Methanobacterium alcaliphilum TaxID=392018 RepID=UPI00200AF295|nr:phosphoserine phosphatase SerB [Methanobacterium alcaliphilum]MCK9152440.1 phosphoserine phosphatase SerB [Methanobacterium alcaliphilum]
MIKLVVFDLDNVIIDGEAIDEIGKLVDVQEQIIEITEKAMQGDVDFETSIKERVKLLKGASVDKIKALAEEMPLMEGAEETIKQLKDKGYKVATISGSFDIISDPIKEKLKLDYSFSNTLLEEDGILTGEVEGPLVAGSKYDVLCQLLETENIALEECVAVGDGANDISMIEAVELGVAFNAKPALKEIADKVIESRNLIDILPLVENLAQGEKDQKVSVLIEGNFDNALDKKNAYEKKLSEISEEREQFNQKAKKEREVRDELNQSLKENLNIAIDFRDKRNKINEEVEKNKKLRDKANEELKKVEWSSGRRDRIKIENEIKKIDKIIETRVLDIKKENKLVKDANDLRKKLMEIQEDEQVQEEALELKKTSESYHAKVVELSEQAQEFHEKMLEYFRKTDEIRTKADEAHKKFLEHKKQASEKHEDFKTVLGEIHKVNKELGGMRSKRKDMENRATRKKNKEEKERAEEIYRKFKEGKKLSTDEILLLQKHDVV